MTEPTNPNLNRRLFVGGTVAAGLAVSSMAGKSIAQEGGDATPVATPGGADAETGGELTIDQTAAQPTPLGPAVPPEFDDPTNWPTEHGNLRGTRSGLGSSISSETVGTLDVAWRLPVDAAGTYGSMTSSPVVVGDTVYIVDMQSNIWSVAKETGEVNWKTEYNVGLLGPNGLAVAYGYVFGILGDTSETVALDAATGKEIWRVRLSNNPAEGIDIAPFVYDNVVYVSTIPGNSSSFYQGGAKGILYGLDAGTGRTLFQWDTTTDQLWHNFRVNSGGGLWHPPVADEAGNIYFCVANPAPFPGNEEFPNASSRPGNNDYSNSIVSIDPIAGQTRWYLNVKPHDLFDLDLHLSPILANVTINGQDRQIAMVSGKLGIVVAVDTETGEELWRVPVGTHQNDNLQALTDEYVVVWPGNQGGTETPMAYSDGVLYLPVLEMPSPYNATGYGDPLFDLNTGTGLIVALDATTGATRWQTAMPTPAYGSVVVVNDVVFGGGLDGIVRGYRTDTGEQIYSFQAGSGLNAPFALSGDYLFIPASGPLIPSDDSPAEPPEIAQELIALRVGGGSATPAT